jgi:hypothetical protein
MQMNASVYVDGKNDAERQVLVQNSAVSQFVGGKNFQNQNGVWVDSDIARNSKGQELVVKFGSDEYFDLVKREPGISQYLAIGSQVTVVWKGRNYRVIL